MTKARRLGPIVGTLLVAALAGGTPHAASNAAQTREDGDRHVDDRIAYAIGLWGDLPYSDEQAQVGVPNLIADMNRHRLAFSVHDGDLKQGNGAPICDDALYTRSLNAFNSLQAPAMFTPGDNDWTDCDRPNNGGFNSLERLTHERQVLFQTSFSFGQRRLRQQVQTDPTCLGVANATSLQKVAAACVENRRWSVGGVTFTTLNIQGSCNNLCGDGADPEEFGARNRANITWMEETFADALSRDSSAIMFISQADPGFSESEFDAPQRDPSRSVKPTGTPMVSKSSSWPCASR